MGKEKCVLIREEKNVYWKVKITTISGQNFNAIGSSILGQRE
jgi:hypothetical protein